jgi:hypothetical protein
VTRVTLEVPGTPVSLNQIGYRSHWSVGSREKKKWESWLGTALMVAQVPRGLEVVAATAEIHFKQKRRRDPGNFRVILEKALGDILQQGWLPDDTAEFFSFGAVQLVAPSPEPLTLVHLDYR